MTEKKKPSGIAWIGDIPQNWDVKRIKYVISDIKDGTHGTFDRVETGELLLSAKNVFDDGIRISDNESEIAYKDYASIVANGFPRKDDVLLCCVGTIGRCCVYEFDTPFAFQRSVSFLRPRKSTVPRFLKYALQSDSTVVQEQLLLNKSAQEGLYMGSVREMVIAVPDMLSEQQDIADYLDTQCAKIDGVIADIEKQIDTLQKYKESLITETVTKGLNRSVPMKNSGIEWIGEMPENWRMSKLGYLGSMQNGISKGAEYFGSGFPFVSYGNVYNNIALPHFVDGLVESTKAEQNQYSVKCGDAFFTRTSETVEEIGFASVCQKTIPQATFAGFLIRFRPEYSGLNMEYAKYYFRASCLRAYFVRETMIVTRASLGQPLLKKLPVLLPPMEEQGAIAKYLDDKCRRIDDVVAEKEKQLQKIRKMKQSMIYEYVTGKKRVEVN